MQGEKEKEAYDFLLVAPQSSQLKKEFLKLQNGLLRAILRICQLLLGASCCWCKPPAIKTETK
jgi:hypothetical protein